MIGIYIIVNKLNNKIYIGSSKNLILRIKLHIFQLEHNKHYNKFLQRSWNKYTKINFAFNILEYCDVKMLLSREQYWLDSLKPEYNIRKYAECNRGVKYPPRTEVHKKKLSEVQKNKVFSEKHLQNLRLALFRRSSIKNNGVLKYNCPDKQRCKCEKCKALKAAYQKFYRAKTKLSSKEF